MNKPNITNQFFCGPLRLPLNGFTYNCWIISSKFFSTFPVSYRTCAWLNPIHFNDINVNFSNIARHNMLLILTMMWKLMLLMRMLWSWYTLLNLLHKSWNNGNYSFSLPAWCCTTDIFNCPPSSHVEPICRFSTATSIIKHCDACHSAIEALDDWRSRVSSRGGTSLEQFATSSSP